MKKALLLPLLAFLLSCTESGHKQETVSEEKINETITRYFSQNDYFDIDSVKIIAVTQLTEKDKLQIQISSYLNDVNNETTLLNLKLKQEQLYSEIEKISNSDLNRNNDRQQLLKEVALLDTLRIKINNMYDQLPNADTIQKSGYKVIARIILSEKKTMVQNITDSAVLMFSNDYKIIEPKRLAYLKSVIEK